MSEWQPIETAPKDGTAILLHIAPVDEGYLLGWNPERTITQVIGWWGHSEWTSHLMEEGTADTEGGSSPYQINIQPTHWMPLPPPPASQQNQPNLGEVREDQLQAIGDVVQYWLDWTTRNRAEEGLTTEADTHIMLDGYTNAPPSWPTVVQLQRWIEALRGPAPAATVSDTGRHD